jgi:hypothetical protein
MRHSYIRAHAAELVRSAIDRDDWTDRRRILLLASLLDVSVTVLHHAEDLAVRVVRTSTTSAGADLILTITAAGRTKRIHLEITDVTDA